MRKNEIPIECVDCVIVKCTHVKKEKKRKPNVDNILSCVFVCVCCVCASSKNNNYIYDITIKMTSFVSVASLNS